MLELIFTTSRSGAETFSWPNPFAVISITDPDSRPVVFKQRNLVARCNLEFWDLLYEPGDGSIIFNSQMARTALNFIEHHCGQAKLLLVHCEAGISRSTGLANALSRTYNIEVRHANAMFANPNPLVTRVLFEEVDRS
jgi:predicted protein tyrosine phosphatase